MLYRKVLLVFLCVYVTVAPIDVFAFHPFYVSVTELSLNSKTRSLEIVCKMFTEDIEDVFKQNYKVSADLSDDKLQEENNRMIDDYIQKHLRVKLDSKTAVLKFLGFERERESVYCYLEVIEVPQIKNITVNNTILQDYKQEQINIMHVTVNGNRKSTKLDFPSSEATFNF